jgi:L-phenylalanine/L-methionine N-acetyltransferase
MQINIVAFEPEHWQAALTICAHPQVARFLGTDPSESAQVWQKRLVEIDTSKYYRLSAFIDDALVGLLSLEIYANPRAKHAAKLWLAVAPQWHGHGVGRALLSRAVEAADRWLNLVRLELHVHADHERAITLYARHGFQVEAQRRCDMLRDGEPISALTMSRLRPGFTDQRPLAPALLETARPTTRATVLIREATLGDAAGLSALFDGDAVALGTMQLPLMPRAVWYTRLQQPLQSQTLLLAISGEQVIGMIGILGISNTRMLHIRSLFMAVHQDLQGQGVGQRLLQAALDLCDGPLRAKRVDLSVFTDSAHALALYQKFGFVIEGRLRCNAFRDGHYVDAYAMARVRGL